MKTLWWFWFKILRSDKDLHLPFGGMLKRRNVSRMEQQTGLIEEE